MEALWFALLSLMLTAYVVLDGFDFGAGIVHLVAAKQDDERRAVLAAIGPVWDGNEVWLVASGGVLVFAFPRAYAAACSGFYLPLVIVLWLLVLRGVSIEFRGLEPNPLWRAFWDATFALASGAMALVLGAALGNVVRGFPIEASGNFGAPLFTDFRPGARPGAFDWYTTLVGLFAFAALGAHGALYVAWKTTGPLRDRCALWASRFGVAAVALFVVVSLATKVAAPAFFAAIGARPLAWLLASVALGGLVAAARGQRRGDERLAFLGSSASLAGLVSATAAALYPVILRSTLDEAASITATNAATSRHGLVVGLFGWVPAMALAVGYFTYLFRSFRGKVAPDGGQH